VRSPRLAAKYGLSVDADLPQIVAQDLTADPDSPVAPTLNILLRKLWTAATAANNSAPHFSVTLYEQLRREGILLDDFLRQQIATLDQEQPGAVRSGFLLDLWAMHTTGLGTAEQCASAELHAAYGHRTDLDAVVQRSKELYVLADPTGDHATGGDTRLAHDTLAPLVRRAYAQSTLPAQQARRLLDSRVAVWQGDPKALLDDTSLALVEKGLPGTRAPSPSEQDLLAQSYAARAARKRNRQLLLWVGAAAAVLLLAMLGLTLQSRADQQMANAASTQIAVTATIAAELNTAETAKLNAQATAVAASAESARAQAAAQNLTVQLADARARSATLLAEVTDAQRLAQLSAQQLTQDPVLSLHLALAALPAAPNQPLAPEAEYALRQAVFSSRERKFITTTVAAPDQIAVRGNRVAVGGDAPAVYDIELTPQLFPLPPEFVDVRGLRWGNDGRLLGWTPHGVWVAGGGEPLHLALDSLAPDLPGEEIRCAEWQPAQQWVAVCTFNALYAWQPESNRVITVTTELDTLENPTEPRRAVWSDDGRYLAGLGARLAVWDSRAPRTPANVFYPPAAPGQPASFAYWLPDESLVAGWFAFGAPELAIHRWQPGSEELEAIPLRGTFNPDAQVETLYVPPADDFGAAHAEEAAPPGEPRLLLWSSDGLLALYSLAGRREVTAAAPLRDLNGVVFSPDGQRIGGYSSSGAAAVWSLPALALDGTLDANDGFVAGPLTYASWLDNDTLALADAEGVIQVARRTDPFAELAVVPLYGYGPAERLARTVRLANGRLLTAGYADGTASSLRIWQLDPAATRPEEGLPAPGADLCTRLHRAVALPPGLGRPAVSSWLAGDELLVEDDAKQFAYWKIGGPAAILPADPARNLFAAAPDGRHVLRYGLGASGEIWSLEPALPGDAAAGTAAWVQVGTLEGELEHVVWNDHGILASFADGTAAVLDPASGRSRPIQGSAAVPGWLLLGDDLLLALGADGVELWRLGAAGTDQQLAAWPAPAGSSLQLDDASSSGDLVALHALPFGPRYVLRLDTATKALTEVWRSTRQHVDTLEAKLNPSLPLLATLDDGVVAIVDLEQGRVVWQSTSIAALAQQSVRAVQWSTDGRYLITQAQPLQQGTVALNIGIWRWDAEQQRLTLLQEVPSSGLLGVSPDMTALLAGEPRQAAAARPYYYPVLTDTLRLKADVEGSCLLPRPLGEEQQQAFMAIRR
jgi:WD40 repeat protein